MQNHSAVKRGKSRVKAANLKILLHLCAPGDILYHMKTREENRNATESEKKRRPL